MIQPSVYRMNYQGLTLAECWRFGRNILGFAFAIVFKLLAKPGNPIWLPPQEAEQACTREELSPAAQPHLAPPVAQLAGLGYRAGQFMWQVFSTRHRGGANRPDVCSCVDGFPRLHTPAIHPDDARAAG